MPTAGPSFGQTAGDTISFRNLPVTSVIQWCIMLHTGDYHMRTELWEEHSQHHSQLTLKGTQEAASFIISPTCSIKSCASSPGKHGNCWSLALKWVCVFQQSWHLRLSQKVCLKSHFKSLTIFTSHCWWSLSLCLTPVALDQSSQSPSLCLLQFHLHLHSWCPWWYQRRTWWLRPPWENHAWVLRQD